jgi:Right handed beta helix region
MKYTSIFALTLLAAVPALAQIHLNITWVSRSGSDDIACGEITSPCLTFQAAHDHTNNSGIVKAMDAGQYGAVSITKPIIIDGNGVGAAIEVFGVGYGVSVNTPGPVEIRNLAIHVPASCNPCNGINQSSGNVSIEDVSITGAPAVGVYVSGGTATIHGLTVTGATNTGIIVVDATVTISDSIVRYSNIGVFLQGFTAVTQALIERSKMISNTTGLEVVNSGFATTARISDSVITGNTTGVLTIGGGQILTFRNNTWAGNTTDGTTLFSVSLK